MISSEYCKDLVNADLILSLNGVAINTKLALDAEFDKYKPGDTVTIKASRGGVEFTCEMTLQEYVPDSIKNKLN